MSFKRKELRFGVGLRIKMTVLRSFCLYLKFPVVDKK